MRVVKVRVVTDGIGVVVDRTGVVADESAALGPYTGFEP